jgi:hypothetical protein
MWRNMLFLSRTRHDDNRTLQAHPLRIFCVFLCVCVRACVHVRVLVCVPTTSPSNPRPDAPLWLSVLDPSRSLTAKMMLVGGL